MMKILRLIIFIIIFIIPIKVNSCPHFDENGNVYFLFPDDKNFENTIILYPRDYYNRLYFYNFNGDMLYDQYEIYIHQEFNIYQVFPDDNSPLTVEGVQKLFLENDYYKLIVPVENTYKESLRKVTKDTVYLFYILQVTNIDNEIYNKEYSVLKKVFDNQPVNYIDNPIIMLDSFLAKQESYFMRDEIKINNYDDPVELIISVNNNGINDLENLIPIRIDDKGNNAFLISESEGYYNIDNNEFHFLITEPGIYTVVEKTGDINPNKIVTVKDEGIEIGEANNNEIIKIIIISILVVIIIIVIGNFIQKVIKSFEKY